MYIKYYPTAISYAILGVPLGMLSISSLYLGLYLTPHFTNMIYGVVLPLLAGIGWTFWVRSHTVTLTRTYLVYKHLWMCEQICKHDMKNINFESGISKYSDKFKPFNRIVIITERKPIYINAKLFPKQLFIKIRQFYTEPADGNNS